MSQAVVCIVESEQIAQNIVDDLRTNGFAGNDISVLFPDRTGTRDFAHEKGTKAPEGATTGATTGGILGGAPRAYTSAGRQRRPTPLDRARGC